MFSFIKISISFVHISQQCGPSPVPNHVRAGRKESQNLSQSQSLHYLTISDPLAAGKQMKNTVSPVFASSVNTSLAITVNLICSLVSYT